MCGWVGLRMGTVFVEEPDDDGAYLIYGVGMSNLYSFSVSISIESV